MIDTVIIKFILTLFNLYLIFYYFFYMKEESFFFFWDRNDRSIFEEKRNTKVGVSEELGQEMDQRRLVPSFNRWKGKIIK